MATDITDATVLNKKALNTQKQTYSNKEVRDFPPVVEPFTQKFLRFGTWRFQNNKKNE